MVSATASPAASGDHATPSAAVVGDYAELLPPSAASDGGNCTEEFKNISLEVLPLRRNQTYIAVRRLGGQPKLIFYRVTRDYILPMSFECSAVCPSLVGKL